MVFELYAAIIAFMVVVGCQHIVISYLRGDVQYWREKLSQKFSDCKHPGDRVEYKVCQECGADTP